MDSCAIYSTDLAGIVVGETAISDVRGEAGSLSYRGIDVAELIDRPFLEVAWLLLFGRRPGEREYARLASFMNRHARLSDHELELLQKLPRDLHPMLVLQGLVPLLALPRESTLNMPLDAEQGLFIAAKLPALIAAQHRLEQSKVPLLPRHGKPFFDNFLYLFHGLEPDAPQVQTLNATQILQMEHSYNAGTFAGRVCASTQAPIQSAIAASIGTLFGRLHGGADQAALEMALAIGGPENAETYVELCLSRGEKIMGMGHREYRTVDPRASLIRPMASALCREGDSRRILATLMAVEKACQSAFACENKQIWANVEFYKGAVFHALGIPKEYFTAMFASARVIGYIAHYLEFQQSGRLIRPRARYIGPTTSSTDKSAA